MFESLSKEILEKLKQAKSKEEALDILKENGIVLTDEDLASIAGGEECLLLFFPRDCPLDCGNYCLLYAPGCDLYIK
jgi:hypothetical protein